MSNKYKATPAEIEAALTKPFDFANAEAVENPSKNKVILSARVEAADGLWVADEASRTGITPSLLTAQLIHEAIISREATASAFEGRTINANDLVRFITQAAKAA